MRSTVRCLMTSTDLNCSCQNLTPKSFHRFPCSLPPKHLDHFLPLDLSPKLCPPDLVAELSLAQPHHKPSFPTRPQPLLAHSQERSSFPRKKTTASLQSFKFSRQKNHFPLL